MRAQAGRRLKEEEQSARAAAAGDGGGYERAVCLSSSVKLETMLSLRISDTGGVEPLLRCAGGVVAAGRCSAAVGTVVLVGTDMDMSDPRRQV